MNDRGDEQTASNAAAATKSQALMQFHATDEDDATRREAPGATAPATVQSENALQRAFERELEDRTTEALDAGEFVIHLQPKLDLRKGQIAGAEALVRWRDPRVGLRLPGAFLPLFEKNGFIVDLDRFVFEQVCALLHAWSVAGVHPVPVSVNLSRTNLLDLTLLQGFERIRELYGVLPSFLEFELAEAVVFEEPRAFFAAVDRMHRAGYACSLDNFGGCRRSLEIMEGLEVDALKLDRAFFGGPYIDPARETGLVASVLNRARELHLGPVAEGVETEEQRGVLADVGCELMQGYLFSPPVSVADFERMLFGREVAAAPSFSA